MPSTVPTPLQPAVIGPDLVLSRRRGVLVLRAPDGTLIAEHTSAADAWQTIDALDLGLPAQTSAAA